MLPSVMNDTDCSCMRACNYLSSWIQGVTGICSAILACVVVKEWMAQWSHEEELVGEHIELRAPWDCWQYLLKQAVHWPKTITSVWLVCSSCGCLKQ
eukprot:4176484-Amphidinium_carterae.1